MDHRAVGRREVVETDMAASRVAMGAVARAVVSVVSVAREGTAVGERVGADSISR